MIYVTRLNGETFAINCDLIEFIESTPDSVISMTTGKKIVVREPVNEILNRVLEYRKKTFENCCICSNKVQRNEV